MVALANARTSTPSARSLDHSGWQVIETRTGSPLATYEQFVYSLDYIDAVVCRDRGSERVYYQQDREFNVTALLDSSGNVVERYRTTKKLRGMKIDHNPLRSPLFRAVSAA